MTLETTRRLKHDTPDTDRRLDGMAQGVLGTGMDRPEGPLKVSGRATYAAEAHPEAMAEEEAGVRADNARLQVHRALLQHRARLAVRLFRPHRQVQRRLHHAHVLGLDLKHAARVWRGRAS